jgi:hypothetical protein
MQLCLPPEIGDGQGKTETDLNGPGQSVDQKLHLGAVVFLLQDAIGLPEDIPGSKFFFCRHSHFLFR